ncbi:MAG: tetratricopeptide repeat protein [Bacteroidales bacterium]
MKVIIIIISLFFFQQVSGQSDINAFLKARSLMEVEKYDSALNYLELAINNNQDNVEFIYNRGLCNFYLKRYDNAIADFLFVNKRRRGMGSLMLAKIEARLNHDELAIKYLREHLSSHYKIPEKDILLDEDFTRLESGNEWRSLWMENEWYTPLDKELQEILYLKSKGEFLEVINRLNDLEERRYKRTLVNQHIAETYLALNNQKAAAEALDKSISADMRNMESLKLRIDLNLMKGDYDKAEKDCNRLLRQSPDEFEYYLVSGRIYSQLEKYEKAVESVNLYLQFYPDSSKAYNELGLIHYNNRKYLDAMKSFNQALSIDNGNASYFYNRGKTYAATKTHRYAIRDYSMALDLDPADPEIWFSKGLTDLELNNKRAACFSFKKAFQYGKYEARDYVQKICGN